MLFSLEELKSEPKMHLLSVNINRTTKCSLQVEIYMHFLRFQVHVLVSSVWSAFNVRDQTKTITHIYRLNGMNSDVRIKLTIAICVGLSSTQDNVHRYCSMSLSVDTDLCQWTLIYSLASPRGCRFH